MTLRYVYALAALLTAIGLSMFFYKWLALGFPVTDNQKTPIWTIEPAIRFDSGPGSIKVNLQIPTLTPGFVHSANTKFRRDTDSVLITEENFCAYFQRENLFCCFNQKLFSTITHCLHMETIFKT